MPDYIQALSATLKADPLVCPLPEDFPTPDGFYYWQQSLGMRLQDVIIEILKEKFITGSRGRSRSVGLQNALPLDIKLRIVEARGLLAKEGRNRNPFCHIEFGDLDKKKDKRNFEVFSTDIIQNTVNPLWNQHVAMTVLSLSNSINLEVWDKLKDQFLGRVMLNISELMGTLELEGRVASWYRLERHPKHKDKYVGGEIFLDISCDRMVGLMIALRITKKLQSAQVEQRNPKRNIEERLRSSQLQPKIMYSCLLRSALVLDMRMTAGPRPGTEGVLSDESKALMRSMGHFWRVSDALQTMMYLELLFKHYREDKIPLEFVLETYDYLREKQKERNWLSHSEVRLALHS